MVELSGISRSPRTLKGDVPDLFQALGDAQVLPATLDNGLIRLTFVAHPAHGVTLSTIEDLHDRGLGPFTWTNEQSSMDGAVTGQLWRINTQTPSPWSRGWSRAFGAGHRNANPNNAVDIYQTTDPEGRDALAFRWEGVTLPGGSTVDVTAVVALGEGEQVARWMIWIGRTGEDLESIDFVDFPILAIRGPVPARTGWSHAASQKMARVLLPTTDVTIVGAVNTPLSAWEGMTVRTHHPTGEAEESTQWGQFESITAQDKTDAASRGRIMYLGTADDQGVHKQFERSGRVKSGPVLLYHWCHRFVPAWAGPAGQETDPTNRFGNVAFLRYPVLTGCLYSTSAAWWHTPAAWYRDHVVEGSGLSCPPKAADQNRTDLARGRPWIGAVNQDPPFDSGTTGSIFTAMADEQRRLLRASVTTAQLNILRSSSPSPDWDPLTLRGCNWLPLAATTSHNHHLSWVPMAGATPALRPVKPRDGFYFRPHVRQELDQIRGMGFNSVRCWGSFIGWCCDRSGHNKALIEIAEDLAARGLGMTFLLWNAVPAGAGTVPGTSARLWLAAANNDPLQLRSLMWTVADNWQISGRPPGIPAGDTDLTHYPEPLTSAEWAQLGYFGSWSETTLQGLIAQYLRDVAQFFKSPQWRAVDRGVELYNEVNIQYSDTVARSAIVDFLCKIREFFRRECPNTMCTVGYAGNSSGLHEELHRRGCTLGFISQHGYAEGTDAGFDRIRSSLEALKTEGDALGIPVALTEFGILPEDSGLFYRYHAMLADLGIGGHQWAPLMSNAYRTPLNPGGPARQFDGILECETMALDITTRMYGRAWSPGWSAGFGGPALRWRVREQADLDATRAWVQT